MMDLVSKRKLILLIICGAVIALFLLVLKSISLYTLGPVFGFYSLFVFLYVASRIGASFFYRSYETLEMTIWPKVSFVVPVFNEQEVIEKTINHCFECDYPKSMLEVVVVNDGSTDDSWEKISDIEKRKTFGSRLTAINLEKNVGKRNAMADAIRKATGEIIIQLDSDSYLEKKSLKNLVSVLQDRKIAGVSAHTDPENRNENYLTKMQSAYYFVSFRVQKAAESSLGLVFCCSGCCSAYRREYLLPLLDEWTNEKHLGVKTIYGDDRGLTNLLIRKGFNTAYSDRAQAYTIVPNNLKQFLKQQRRWKRSWIIYTAKSARYIIKRDPFIAAVYLFPQMVLNYMAPILTFYTIFYMPLASRKIPVVYFVGLFSLYGLYILYYAVFRSDIYRPYIIMWGSMNIILCSIMFPYAFLTLRDGRWGTR